MTAANQIVSRNFELARAHIRSRLFPDADLALAVNLKPPDLGRPLPVRPAAHPQSGPMLRWVEEALIGTRSSEAALREAIKAAHGCAELGGVVHLDEQGALAQARTLDAAARAGRSAGPLHGVPITVKDVIHVAGMPTLAGSAAYRAMPDRDAAGVALLRAAGAVVLGKVATHEFALGVTTPQARNPWDPARIPGGSSGGSAIALVKGIGAGSLGTDTRASIRVPAALSGVVGFKPTFGRISTAGVVTLSWSMDHVAPMARNVADAALLMDILLGTPGDLTGYNGASVAGLRIGVPAAAFEDADPGVAAAATRAIAVLGELGAVVVLVGRPNRADFELANLAGLIVSRCEAAAYHRALGTDLSRYWDETRLQLEAAAQIPAGEYLAAQRARSGMMAEMGAVFDGIDVLAMPTSLVPAPLVPEAEQYLMTLARNCIPWSFVGFPAISLPAADRVRGLPVGLQLVAPPCHEAVLVALGTAYERSTGLA